MIAKLLRWLAAALDAAHIAESRPLGVAPPAAPAAPSAAGRRSPRPGPPGDGARPRVPAAGGGSRGADGEGLHSYPFSLAPAAAEIAPVPAIVRAVTGRSALLRGIALAEVLGPPVSERPGL